MSVTEYLDDCGAWEPTDWVLVGEIDRANTKVVLVAYHDGAEVPPDDNARSPAGDKLFGAVW